jgi:predicted  nucleic acid-binding Zn-ribbon protein|tara:strand:+ start:49 stop:252 length:204 start_codon:yes stop_codon:yes gene_type:complete
MEIEKEIKDLKKSIIELELLVEELISSLEAQKLRVSNKEKIISQLKEEVRTNIEKIDEIIEEYHANT